MAMTTFMAIAHLAGAFIALTAFGIVWWMFLAWWNAKSEARAVEELSVALGVTVEKMQTDAMAPQVIKVLGERFSSELLRNRISDLCGWIRAAFGWTSNILVYVILLAIAWFTFTEDRGNAIYAWIVIPITLVCVLLDVTFFLTCRFLTGRYPGQARYARKQLAEFIKTHKAV
jgi:hypothetical protein